MTSAKKVLVVLIVFIVTPTFTAQAVFDHKLGVWTRDWSNGAPSGEVMFVDNMRLGHEKEAKGAEKYVPRLAYFMDNKWKEVRQRAMEDKIYAPFVGAAWFFLIVPAGKQQFRLTLGTAAPEFVVDVQQDMIHVVPFVKTHIAEKEARSKVGSKGRELFFDFTLNPTVLIPRSTRPEAEAQLRQALGSQEPGVRYRACRELERLREKTPLAAETVDILRALLKNESVHVLHEGVTKALGGN